MARTRATALRHMDRAAKLYPALIRPHRIEAMCAVVAQSADGMTPDAIGVVLDVGTMIFAFDDLCDEGHLGVEEAPAAAIRLADIAAAKSPDPAETDPLAVLVASIGQRLRRVCGSAHPLWGAWCATTRATLLGIAAGQQIAIAEGWPESMSLDGYLAATGPGMGVTVVCITAWLAADDVLFGMDHAVSLLPAVLHLEAATRLANDRATLGRERHEDTANALLLSGVTADLIAERTRLELEEGGSLLGRVHESLGTSPMFAVRFVRACMKMYDKGDGFNDVPALSRRSPLTGHGLRASVRPPSFYR